MYKSKLSHEQLSLLTTNVFSLQKKKKKSECSSKGNKNYSRNEALCMIMAELKFYILIKICLTFLKYCIGETKHPPWTSSLCISLFRWNLTLCFWTLTRATNELFPASSSFNVFSDDRDSKSNKEEKEKCWEKENVHKFNYLPLLHSPLMCLLKPILWT